VLSHRAALLLSRRALTRVTGVIRRDLAAIGVWLTEGQTSLDLRDCLIHGAKEPARKPALAHR
jgi:hypothetical protein